MLSFPISAFAAIVPLGQTIEIELPLHQVVINQPLKACGVSFQEADRINSVTTKNELIANASSKLGTLTINVSREDEEYTAVCSKADIEKILRISVDHVAGTGTLSFLDTDSNRYYALGHPIIERVSGEQPTGENGLIRFAAVETITKSQRDKPGFKQTIPVLPIQTAVVHRNGIYGLIGPADEISRWFEKSSEVKMSTAKPGPATIYTVLTGTEPQSYTIEIEEVNGQEILFSVTDQRIIEKAGGIIQGMSGSPIIQNQNLVGVITHMNVRQPTKGAAIDVSTMHQEPNL